MLPDLQVARQVSGAPGKAPKQVVDRSSELCLYALILSGLDVRGRFRLVVSLQGIRYTREFEFQRLMQILCASSWDETPDDRATSGVFRVPWKGIACR